VVDDPVAALDDAASRLLVALGDAITVNDTARLSLLLCDPRCRTYEPARRLTLSGPPTSLVVDEDHSSREARYGTG
jgi:hypothetical protein